MTKKKKTIIIVSAIAGILLITGGITSCVSSMNAALSQASEIYTETVKAEKQNLLTSISASGTVESNSLVKVTSTLNARVKTLNANIGDYVNEGDILCIFDSSELQKEYDNVKKSIEKSDALSNATHEINQRNLNDAINEKDNMLNKAQKAIDDAEQQCDNAYNKYNNLYDKLIEYENKRNELYDSLDSIEDENQYNNVYRQYEEYVQICQSTEAELNALDEQLSSYDSAVDAAYDSYYSAERSADSTIQSIQDTINAEQLNKDDSLQQQLEKIQEQIAECTVTAPKSGIITSVNIAEGSFPTSEAIMSIENMDSLKIKVQIKETDILSIKEGQETIIKTNATGNDEIKGTVSRVVNILGGADAMNQQAGGYTAEITINDKNTRLLIGMTAKAKIILDKKDNVLAVPYDSIVENGDECFVFIAKQENDGTYKAVKAAVEKGLEADYYTEITSSEISEGDLIISMPNMVYDGKIININDTDTETDGE